jgi:DNA polymerase-3 subunit delta'
VPSFEVVVGAATTPEVTSAPEALVETDPWAAVVGQERAVAQLRAAVAAPVHAYLLVGPRGSGKRVLAQAFAAELLSADAATPEDAERHRRLAMAGTHPDLVITERTGPWITAEQAREIVDRAARSAVEGERKVLVLDELHLVLRNAPILLKAIEEPAPGTVFLVLAEEVPPELVTIASRCVRVDLGPVPADAIAARLEVEGIEPDAAREAAMAAAGDLGRARLLATDRRLALRRDAWAAVPSQLDGSGATACRLVDDLFAMIDDAASPLRERQAAEEADLDERVKLTGERGAGRKALADRHKREQRRLRIDELRFGLAVLARHYRDELATAGRPGPVAAALAALQHTAEGLVRNPNEQLQFQALFVRLGDLA